VNFEFAPPKFLYFSHAPANIVEKITLSLFLLYYFSTSTFSIGGLSHWLVLVITQVLLGLHA